MLRCIQGYNCSATCISKGEPCKVNLKGSAKRALNFWYRTMKKKEVKG